MNIIPGVNIDKNTNLVIDIPKNIDAFKIIFEKDNQKTCFEKAFLLTYSDNEEYEIIVRKKQ